MRKRERVQVDCSEGGRTHQSFKDECDINNLVRRFGVGLPTGPQQYLDVSEVPDFLGSVVKVKDVESSFRRLPAAARRFFGDSPWNMARYVDAAINSEDSEAIAKLRELGVLEPLPVVPAAPPTPPVEPAPEPGAGGGSDA